MGRPASCSPTPTCWPRTAWNFPTGSTRRASLPRSRPSIGALDDVARQIAEAFSGHRFSEAYPALAPDVRWIAVGQGVLTGRDAVVHACEDTLAELQTGTAEFLRFVVIADGNAVAVDAIGRYVDADGEIGVVSSCDIYEFRDGVVSSITSYTVELDPADIP